MTAANERMVQLLEKWQRSLDLHSRYAALPEDQYWLVQPWPSHQRPTRWVIDLARQRTAELLRLVRERTQQGDSTLTEALELMSFLTNLVGSQQVERFIPLAEPERERTMESLTVEQPALVDAAASLSETRPQPALDASGTRPQPVLADTTVEQPAIVDSTDDSEAAAPRQAPKARPAAKPKPKLAPSRATSPPPPVARPAPAAPRAAAATRPAAPAPRPAQQPPAQRQPVATASAAAARQIREDAVRLLQWGREWHELPEAIARMAGRPPSDLIRAVLREQRDDIERSASPQH